MKILILGGTGLISTQITQQLLARGDEVWHFNRGQRNAGFGGVQFDGPVNTVKGDRIFDNSAAKRDLGFEYTVRWKEGARRLVNWLDANKKIEDSDLDHFEDDLIVAWEQGLITMKEHWAKTLVC